MLSKGQMKALVILIGTGHITALDTEVVDFQKGDCLLIPASFEGVMHFVDDTEYLIATI